MAIVRLTPQAAEEFDALTKTVRERVLKMLARLEKWPDVSGVKALSGNLAGSFRARVGDYRIRFKVAGETVSVDKIGHRRDVYED
jgi:mRNA-degrading endonuclease RelE of RelBE toxin-antitoxin system